MAARIRKDDIVQVIAGDHKGATGKVLRVDLDKNRVFVEGVNMVVRHVRRSRTAPQGGRVQKEAPLHMSNVMPMDPKTGKPTRVRFAVERDAAGHVVAKRRVSVKGTLLGEVTRAKRGAARKTGA